MRFFDAMASVCLALGAVCDGRRQVRARALLPRRSTRAREGEMAHGPSTRGLVVVRVERSFFDACRWNAAFARPEASSLIVRLCWRWRPKEGGEVVVE